MLCPHGGAVWQADPHGLTLRNGKQRLNNCPSGDNQCRQLLRQRVNAACVARIKLMGDTLGRDRVFVGTCAFGPPSEDYTVLKAMAQAMPRSSFQKLGLSAAHLRTALSSLTRCDIRKMKMPLDKVLSDQRKRSLVYITIHRFFPHNIPFQTAKMMTIHVWIIISVTKMYQSSPKFRSTLTTMMTETSGGTSGLTRRSVKQVKHQSYEENTMVTHGIDWFIFTGEFVVQKEVFALDRNDFVNVAFTPSQEMVDAARRMLGLSGSERNGLHRTMSHGLAYTEHSFAEGAERIVFQCSEVI